MDPKHIDHLIAPIHERTCEVHAGTITYNEKDGTPVVAEFYVKTCQDETTREHIDTQARGDREDDLNEQYEDEVSALMERGCTDIRYKGVMPNPFF